ncbi:hypothetical protein L484_025471 [Morus notabilis]|uniref:Uncharacterized protein n=1 Tax=Morus notabilis TaxID=981085 RepID=W9SD91_9ROSA|nr:hypothetical protein L484_025471 [Morus notabilis]
MDVSRATNHLGSSFTCNIAFDLDAENHHFESCPNLPDESLLKRHPYFVVRLNAVHAIRFRDLINGSQSVEIPVAVAAYLDKWLVIPRHVFFAKEPPIIRNVLFSMGVTRDLIDYFAPRISSFFAAMAEIPRHADYRIVPLALTVISETPYRESEIELAIRESLAVVGQFPRLGHPLTH